MDWERAMEKFRSLMMDMSEVKGTLDRALSDKDVVKDLMVRVERLETRVV